MNYPKFIPEARKNNPKTSLTSGKDM